MLIAELAHTKIGNYPIYIEALPTVFYEPIIWDYYFKIHKWKEYFQLSFILFTLEAERQIWIIKKWTMGY